MVRNHFFILMLLIGFCAGCSNPLPSGRDAGQAKNPASEGRCGDSVCDGPENNANCPEDCGSGISRTGSEAEQPAMEEKSPQSSSEMMIGLVEAEIQLDRTPGMGDCGVDPWYSPDCTMGVKMWWELHMNAHASAPVIIVPDGHDRWVITSEQATAAKYGINLADYAATEYAGKYTSISINPAATNPECTATIEGPDFDFEVMGTREEGLMELILSANPVEYIEGNCMQAAFAYDSQFLLYGWAYALTGDKGDLSFQLNNTFMDAPGSYTFEVQVDANPSPEKRDNIKNRLTFLCLAEEAPGVRAPTACPWE